MRSPKLSALVFVGLALVLFAPQVSFAQYAISTVAGGGPNNLAALSASIGNPGSVALDSTGNVYIADSNSSHIFVANTGSSAITVATIVIQPGEIATVAGNGTYGYSGDGGPATSAALNRPEGVFVDSSGNIFIADTDNSVIREVVASTGSVTTVAGNGTAGYNGDGISATTAELYDPYSVFVDSKENIFIADTDNCLIRKVSGGNISTIAGNPTLQLPCGYAGDTGLATVAQIDAPEGVVVDGSGNVFIADTDNSVIREVTIANGFIQTVAGTYYDFETTGLCQYSGDGSSATSSYLCLPAGVFVVGSNVYIADTNNLVIREFVTGGNIETVAGDNALGAGYSGDKGPATSAQLNYPNAVFVDSSGDIFIADLQNFVVREVTASNSDIQTVIGNNTLAFSGDGGSALDAELNVPGGVSADTLGDIFIADTSNNLIRVANTGIRANTVAGVTIQPGDIQTVAGSYYVPVGDVLCDYSGDNGPPLMAQFCAPGGVFVDGFGNIFIADTQNNRIRVVNTSTVALTYWGLSIPPGEIATVAGNGTLCPDSATACGDNAAASSAELANPTGIFVDSGENIFIADTDDYVVREVAASSGNITTVAGNYVQCNPLGVTPCGDGSTATGAQLGFPSGVYVDTAGNIYIADTDDNRIRVVANPNNPAVTIVGVAIPPGDIATVAGTGARGYSGDSGPATSALLDTPFGLFVDSSGDIFIADTENSVIREVVNAGTIQTVAGNNTQGFSGDGGQSTNAELNFPSALIGNSAGTLFVADTDNERIRELVPSIFVAVTPNPVNVAVSTQQQFTATVTGTTNTSVTWQVNGVVGGNSTVGTITTTGLFQAPATIPTPATVTVSAISAADGTTSGSAQATIVAAGGAVTVTVSTNPAITEVYTTTTQSFIATVTGASNPAVTWQVNGVAGGSATIGTIDGSGNYTGPTAVPNPATVTVEAVSQADSSAVGSESFVIVTDPTAAQPVPQTISPGAAATYSLLLNENTGAPGKPITLSCMQSTLPPNATYAFNPSTITPGAQAVSFTLTITVPSGSASLQPPAGTRLLFYGAFVPLVGILLAGIGRRNGRRSKRQGWLWLAGLCMVLVLLNACGGGGSSGSTQTNPELGTYNVKVQGTTSAQPNPVTITTAGLTVAQ